MRILPILVLLDLTFCPAPLRADEPPVTKEDVLAMMAVIPASSHTDRPEYQRPGHWDKVGIADELAEAIALVAPNRHKAALLSIYAAFEGGNRRCPKGDGGKSLGTFQLQGLPVRMACNPLPAVRAWLTLAAWSEKQCERLKPEERLALLASGSCDKGRKLARDRDELASRIETPGSHAAAAVD